MSAYIKSEVQELLRMVPVPPGYQFPTGASEEQLESVENRLGFPLPPTLREWLKYCNGPLVGPGGLLGVNKPVPALDIEACMRGHAGWVERKYVPVAGDGCGNYYVIDASLRPTACPVLFVDTVRDPLHPVYVVASDLWHFLRFVLLKELGKTKWPFSREEVSSGDPAIMTVSAAPRPWEVDRASSS